MWSKKTYNYKELALLLALLELLGTLAPGCVGNSSETEPGHWLAIHCKLQGVDALPAEAANLDLLLNGKEGLKEYYRDISYGTYVPEFTHVQSWITVEQTPEEDSKLSRGIRIKNCVDAHVRAGDVADIHKYDGIIVFRNVNIDSGNAGNVLLDVGAWNVTFGAHEMGHTLGLEHSFDTSDRKNSTWSAPGEYFDPWDIMSAMAVYDFTNANGFTGGPDLNASSKILLGWMPAKNIHWLNFSELAAAPLGLTLGRYDQPDGPNPLVIVVRMPDGRFYTVEFRTKSGWDRAIPGDGVMIHRVEQEGARPYVMPGGAYQPGDSFASDEGLRIDVLKMNAVSGEAEIALSRSVGAGSGGPASKSQRTIPKGTRIPQLPLSGI